MNKRYLRDIKSIVFGGNKRFKQQALLGIFMLISAFSFGQVQTEIDSTSIKIGAQVTYKITVEADTTQVVVFPEGQTFQPLEMIESYKVDTTKKDAKYQLVKKYGLTQFDSGKYTIPAQKILIGNRPVLTDSLRVEVRNIAVDTTKQKLYDIKPLIGVEKSASKWWLYLLIVLAIVGLIAFLLYWFIWREKPLTEEEKIAQLPPYDRAKLALQELDDAGYLVREDVKGYYSDLTMIIRKYLDEKVYERSLESTTDELVKRLKLLKDGNQIDLSVETIKNIETILKRADLVKFAKSKPDFDLAKLDRNTIDIELDQVKEALPEPTEEELLEDLAYQEEMAKKKHRRKVIITVVIAAVLVIGTTVGFVAHYGFTYVKDTILGHESKELLEEKDWVTSEYGSPGVIITTPKVLKRVEMPIPEEMKDKIVSKAFMYGGLDAGIEIIVTNTKYNFGDPQQQQQQQQQGQVDGETKKPKIDLTRVAERQLQDFENREAQNIITKNEQFITPNGQEGLKTFGTANFKSPLSEEYFKGEYVILGFTAENVLQTVVMIWEKDDSYANQISKRVLESIELLKLEEEDQ